jgi:NADPH-dependent curcumin reductase CurA
MTQEGVNRRWSLAARPGDSVSPADFRKDSSPIEPRPSQEAILLRHELIACAPTIRNWISGHPNSFWPTVEIGQPVLAPTASRIIRSDDPKWPVGARVLGLGSWQDMQWAPSGHGLRRVPDHISSRDAMGLFGMNALTAYFGLLVEGDPKPGQTLVVSGAAGSVGSMAAQIGRIFGCRVVGLCGSPEKARWLLEDCRIDAVINYAAEDVPRRLDELCPDGIDIVFDNVGGEFLHQALARTKRRGRILLCGQIATYDVADPMAGRPLDMMRIVYGGIRLQGFLVGDYAARFDEAIEKIGEWARQGLVVHRDDVRDGFDRLPETFASLFSGGNRGTLLARIADERGDPL